MTQPESHDDIPNSAIPLHSGQPRSDKPDGDDLTDAADLPQYDPVTALLAALRDDIGEQNFQHWFHKRTRFDVSGDRFVVHVANPFILNWLLRRFRSALNRAAQVVLGLSASCQLEVDASLLSEAATAAKSETDGLETSRGYQKRVSAASVAAESSSTR